ncbi:hypothetical protein C5L18_000205 [Lactobacillus amylolyticus]|nr:hypothetical protein C5L18_000205 [Lactobacillus amylolyticus]
MSVKKRRTKKQEKGEFRWALQMKKVKSDNNLHKWL